MTNCSNYEDCHKFFVYPARSCIYGTRNIISQLSLKHFLLHSRDLDIVVAPHTMNTMLFSLVWRKKIDRYFPFRIVEMLKTNNYGELISCVRQYSVDVVWDELWGLFNWLVNYCHGITLYLASMDWMKKDKPLKMKRIAIVSIFKLTDNTQWGLSATLSSKVSYRGNFWHALAFIELIDTSSANAEINNFI